MPSYYSSYKDEDEEEPKKKKCRFMIDPEYGTRCNKETVYDSDFCVVHKDKKCYCGSQATHYCEYCLRSGKQVKLCDNYFCEVHHNSLMKHLKMRRM